MLTLHERSYNWAVKHALISGDTNLLSLPFEYQAIEFDWDNILPFLLSVDVITYKTRPHRQILVPKSKYGFRSITQLDPIDFIIYTALIYEIGKEIEYRRIPTSDNVVFSYRFAPDESTGSMFDRSLNYRAFVEETKNIISSESPSFVAVTDISDFYLRIYHHRLENALHAATTKTNHIKAIKNLLSQWNETETFGIPVGGAPSRMLAEVAISDVDEALLANNIRFIRFNDDYRIFAKNKSEAYRHLAFLANTLYKNHGLTLQVQKTNIFTGDDFSEKFIQTPDERELNTLQQKFQNLAQELGLSDWYEEIEYKDLTPAQKEQVNSLNLVSLFQELLQEDELDLLTARFILRRMGQLGDSALVDLIFDNMDSLYPVFPDIIIYFQNIRNLKPIEKKNIGQRVLGLLENSIVSELDYHRVWALNLFTQTTEWDHEDRFVSLLTTLPDLLSRRELILALGRASTRHWFQSHWRNLFDESHWPRRAFIAAASCLPIDARKHWYKSIDSRLDELERTVLRWAKQNPFG